MFEWLKNYLLLQEIKSSSNIPKQFIEWDKAGSVAIIVAREQFSSIKEFANQTGKKVDLIVFHSDKTSETKDCFLSFNKKDFNLFGLPKPGALKKLRSRSFDVVISTDFSNSGLMKALAGLAPAKCKLGPESANYSDFFDISIQSTQSDFLKQALKYLMMIKS